MEHETALRDSSGDVRSGIALEREGSCRTCCENLLDVRRVASEPSGELLSARRDLHGPAAPLPESSAGTGLSEPVRASAENTLPAERMGAKWLSDLLGLEAGSPERASWADLSGA